MSYHNQHYSGSQNIEQVLRSAAVPIDSDEREEASDGHHRGILLNRSDILSWTGPVPISQYRLNVDPNPEVITKKNAQPIEYNQEIQVRYLRPPTPAPAGDIIIREQPHSTLPPAPPLVLRLPAPEPCQPETLIFREPPPPPPIVPPTKVITIPGKTQGPPARKVIIEKLAPLPPKPPSVVIEKWLPYKEPARRVIFEPAPAVPPHDCIKNLVLIWMPQDANVKKNVSVQGVTKFDPKEYLAKYGQTLRQSHEYSSLNVEPPAGELHSSKANQLVGAVEALKHLDLATLDREGLGAYRHYLSSGPSPSPGYHQPASPYSYHISY